MSIKRRRVGSSLKSPRELALENLALRQQLAILHRKTQRSTLTKADRARLTFTRADCQ